MEDNKQSNQKEDQDSRSKSEGIFITKQKIISFGVGILILGISVGVGATLIIPFVLNSTKLKTQQQAMKVVDEAEMKRQELANFYSQISTAQDNQDWAAMYELVPQSFRDDLSKEQFIALGEKRTAADKAFSRSTVVNSLVVNDDKGIVDRTVIICLIKDCTGDNRKEDNAKMEFVYINRKWQMPDVQKPSERALNAVTYLYLNWFKSEQEKFTSEFGYGSGSDSFAIKNAALAIEGKPGELALLEAKIDKDKEEKNRPVMNYQPPAVVLPPVVIQQPDYPKNCTSNTIGGYTYTNCY